jgi:hypothetical protein
MILTDPKDDMFKKGITCKHIRMRVRFLPAGKLTVTIDRAKDLRMPKTAQASDQYLRMDPYVSLTMEGNGGQVSLVNLRGNFPMDCKKRISSPSP